MTNKQKTLYTCETCNKKFQEKDMSYCSKEDGYECDTCNDKWHEKEDEKELMWE